MKDFDAKIINARLKKEYPEYTNIGILGSVGGSWASPFDWKCPACKGKTQLVVWNKVTLLDKVCFDCWEAQSTQLTLF